MKKIVILGSTGSVGKSALGVISRHRDKFKVVGLTAGSNTKELAKQAKLFKPRLLALAEASGVNELKKLLKTPKNIFKGSEGICEVASMSEADIIIVALSGIAALAPLLSAIKAKKTIALANKESIVAAGPIIMNMAATRGVKIIPIDSEHNSVFQCLEGKNKSDIKKIFLMGSGGPLRNISRGIFDTISPSRILKHPVWKMGKKISVDSATMMNKGLEVIEAMHLFGMGPDKIDVLLHPEALIHSMVEFTDGNIIANLFYPDMRIPIFDALCYPKRVISRLPKINFSKFKKISFEKPDLKKFPALKLSYEVAKKRGTLQAVLNAANEEAVSLYLDGRVNFTRIVDITAKVLSRHRNNTHPSLDQILFADKWAREEVGRLAG